MLFALSFQQPVSWQCETFFQLPNNFPGKNNNKPLEPKELFNQFLPFCVPSLLFPGQLVELEPLNLTQQNHSPSNYSALDWQSVLPINLPQKKSVFAFQTFNSKKRAPFEFIRLHLFYIYIYISIYILLSYPGHLSNSDSFFFGSWKYFSLLLFLSMHSSLKQSSPFYSLFLPNTVEVR